MLAMLLAALAVTQTATGANRSPDGDDRGADRGRAKVQVATTGNRSERFKTLPISRRPWQRPRVVMSLKRRQMPRLAGGDVLRTSAELQLTNNCTFPGRRCVGPTYRYSPRIEARLELSPSTGPSSKKATTIARSREICGQSEPHREHHCVLVMRVHRHVLHRSEAPCAPRRCRLNLVASAHHRKRRSGHRILVGGNRPDGSIPQDRGRINLVHIRPQRRPPKASRHRTGDLRYRSVATDLRRRSVLSVPLRKLRSGEKLEAEAALTESISHLPYTVRTTAHLVLASSPSGVVPDRHARRVGFLAGELGESNGFNCPLPRGSCKTRKVGVMKIRRASKRTMYVNLVLMLGPKRAEARPGDAGRLGKGRLRVTRWR
jgi:hypothetical protein